MAETDNNKHALQVCRQMRYAPNPLSCGQSGSEAIMRELHLAVTASQLDVAVVSRNCMLLCESGPNIKLMPENITWNKVSCNSIPQIIETCKKVLNKN